MKTLLLFCLALPNAIVFSTADTPVTTFDAYNVIFGLDFTADGTQLLVTGGDVKLWDVAKGTLLRTFGSFDSVARGALSADGSLVAAGAKKLDAGTQLLKVWRSGDGSEVLSLDVSTHGMNEGVNCVAFSPDGAKIAVAGEGGGGQKPVKVFDVASGNQLHSFDIGTSPQVVAFDPAGDGATLGIGWFKKLQLYSLTSGNMMLEIMGGDKVHDFQFGSSGGEVVMASGNSKWMKLANTTTGADILKITHEEPVLSVAISQDGTQLASGQKDGTVKLFNAADGTLVRTISNAHDGFVLALSFSPDGKTLASGGEDKARIWCVAECDFTSDSNLASPSIFIDASLVIAFATLLLRIH